MSVNLQALGARIAELTADAERLGGSARIVELSRHTGELLRALNAAEAEHVRAALADESFAFESGQAALASLRSALARIARRLGALAGIPQPLARELHEIALVADKAPMTSRSDLGIIRLSMDSRARGASIEARA